MVQAEPDGWNYLFYTLECILDVIFLPIVSLLFYICVTQKNLHANFRVTLILIAFGHLATDLAYLSLVVARMCCIGLRNPPIVNYLLSWKFNAMNIHTFAWIVLITERTIATVFVGVYETEFNWRFTPVAICGVVVSRFSRSDSKYSSV
ncbi:hypothetical protein COOONC_20552 [Cooperia oncophora]